MSGPWSILACSVPVRVCEGIHQTPAGLEILDQLIVVARTIICGAIHAGSNTWEPVPHAKLSLGRSQRRRCIGAGSVPSRVRGVIGTPAVLEVEFNLVLTALASIEVFCGAIDSWGNTRKRAPDPWLSSSAGSVPAWVSGVVGTAAVLEVLFNLGVTALTSIELLCGTVDSGRDAWEWWSDPRKCRSKASKGGSNRDDVLHFIGLG